MLPSVHEVARRAARQNKPKLPRLFAEQMNR